MATLTTILTPSEILQYSGISDKFPPCDLRTIHSVEFGEFVEVLGSAFYDTLKNDLVDYSAVADYSNTTSYVLDDVVKWKGTYRKALGATTGNLPDNIEYWTEAEKFGTECYNTLWCTFLAPYLAWTVIESRLPFIFRQIKGEGIVAIFGPTFKEATLKEFHTLNAAVKGKIERAFRNLDHYMKSTNPTAGCFGSYLGIAESCCKECGLVPESCICNNDAKTSTGYGYSFG